MKKALIAMTTMTLLGAGIPRAEAHGSGCAVAAGVIGGIGAGIVISEALRPHPVYVAPAPVVVQQPTQVVYQQPQQVVYQQPTQVVTAAPQQVVVVQQPSVVYAPAPVVYAAPVYARPFCPAPVVSLGFTFGHGGHYRGHGHW